MPAQPMTPMFLDGPHGRLFALQFLPAGEPRAHILYLPPLCEEMNRCRHLVAAQARRFAAAGYACLLLDPTGTGDSDGELSEVDWDRWCADALFAADWCARQNAKPVILWGLRLGALLALDLAAREPRRFTELLLWQPVTNGNSYLTQVLRARIAYLSGLNLPPETTEGMRQRFAAGDTVEVAGYVLGGALCSRIDTLQAGGFPDLGGIHIHWLQQSSRPGEEPSAAVRKVVEQLQAQGNSVEVTQFNAPQLWQLSERADCGQLLEKTSALELSR